MGDTPQKHEQQDSRSDMPVYRGKASFPQAHQQEREDALEPQQMQQQQGSRSSQSHKGGTVLQFPQELRGGYSRGRQNVHAERLKKAN